MVSTASDSLRVRFVGPLAPHSAGLADEFSRLGYSVKSAVIVVQFAAHLSRWLALEQMELSEVTDAVIDRFLAVRRAEYTSHYSRRALQPLLAYLRCEGLVPPEVKPVAVSGIEVLLTRYRRYLVSDRGLSGPVADAYSHWVTPFVTDVLGGTDPVARVAVVTAADVAGFLASRLPSMTRKTAQMTACSLRSFFRFAHAEKLTGVMLADAIPAVAHRRLSGLPEPLAQAQVTALLGVCDRTTRVGRRDFAVITLLCRLGLRCGEVSGLLLSDLDWRAGVVTIHGKGGRVDRLPLPVDVGQAIVAYLRDGRPETTARTVFVRAVAPFTPLASASLSCIVARAAERAGLGTVHAHRLRHTMASRVLNAGASLEEVSHLLRHASPATTAIYAKTDLTRLATISRPWPLSGRVS
ncbi:MAG TPA: site-specific integrase [Dermatophilaceae bacterium]|nr:site-specific integrase [Dermatophilaceae bacterium]